MVWRLQIEFETMCGAVIAKVGFRTFFKRPVMLKLKIGYISNNRRKSTSLQR